MRSTNKRFEKEARKLGFTVLKGRRFRDIDEVLYKRLKLFSIPSRMNAYTNPIYKYYTMPIPNFHELKRKAKIYKFLVLNPNWFQSNLKEYANQKFNPHEYEI